MSDVAANRRPPNETDKKLAFAFLRHLQTLSLPDEDATVATNLLSDLFHIDAAASGGVHDTGVDLGLVFQKACQEQIGDDKDSKFQAFLSLLEKKGYFKDAAPGTDVYEERLAKARIKFQQRNNPFEGLDADALKTKGNELMAQQKHKEAIAYYTKAIEMDDKNYICYANRAAAHLHLNDHRLAVLDCEKSIAIHDKYPKAYARLGTAHFYAGSYADAVRAFSVACQLDPSNTTYAEDLKRAEQKISVAGNDNLNSNGSGGMPFGGMNQMLGMMKDPRFSGMMEKMMQDPQMLNMAKTLSENMMKNGGMPSAEALAGLSGDPSTMAGQPQIDADGNVCTPFGKLNKDRLEQLRQEGMNSPKMQAIHQDVQANGMSAFYKYMGDPEVMELMMKLTQDVASASNPSSN